jgi:small neutral amino acid transporter SnatA (MarC family)
MRAGEDEELIVPVSTPDCSGDGARGLVVVCRSDPHAHFAVIMAG